MTFHGRSEKTNFSPHFLTKTSKLSHVIPENVVKISILTTSQYSQNNYWSVGQILNLEMVKTSKELNLK